MKRFALLFLFAGLLACAGCFTAAPPEGLAPVSMTPMPATAARSYPPVTKEQVNDNNTDQIAQALLDEMDRDQQQLLLATPR